MNKQRILYLMFVESILETEDELMCVFKRIFMKNCFI